MLRLAHEAPGAQAQPTVPAEVAHAQRIGGEAGAAVLRLPTHILEGQVVAARQGLTRSAAAERHVAVQHIQRR